MPNLLRHTHSCQQIVGGGYRKAHSRQSPFHLGRRCPLHLHQSQLNEIVVEKQILVQGTRSMIGHDHDHGAYPGECAYDAMQLTESESDQHRPPHSHDQEKGNDKSKKCYCSCLGGFIAHIIPIHYQVTLQLTSLEHESLYLYHYLYIPFIYHPPIART